MLLASYEAANFVHVLGAMLLVSALVLAVAAGLLSRRGDARFFSRLAFRSLLLAGLPGWLLMRIGAQWVYSEGGFGDRPEDPSWIGIGFMTSEAGLVVLIAATVLAGLGARRLGRGQSEAGGLRAASSGLVGLLLAAYLVTIWAMTVQPD